MLGLHEQDLVAHRDEGRRTTGNLYMVSNQIVRWVDQHGVVHYAHWNTVRDASNWARCVPYGNLEVYRRFDVNGVVPITCLVCIITQIRLRWML